MGGNMEVTLSVCTASRNRWEHLLALAGALKIVSTPLEWRIAESYTEQLMWTRLSDIAPPWTYGKRVMPPEGATHALNKIFPDCEGPYVLLLADDMLPYPGSVDQAVAFMEGHPTVGQGALYITTEAHRCHVPPWGGWMYAQAWIVRREVGQQVGWYDSSCRHAGVDNDFSAKILEAGYGVVAIPGACVKTRDPRDETHGESAKNSEADMKMIEERWRPHQPRLCDVWRTRWQPLSGAMECPRRDHAVVG